MTPAAARRLATVLRPQAVRWAESYVDAQDAEDVAQSAIEVLLRRAEDIDQAKAHEFLRTAVWKTASTFRRPRRREVLTETDRVDEAPDPEVTLASAEVSQAVRDAVARMPESRRRIIEVIDGRTVADVAREEGIPESTARGRLEAAEDELRADLTRQRVAEKRKSGSSSWCFFPWFTDVRAAFKKAAVAFAAAGALGGALHHLSAARLGPTSIEVPARVLDVDTIRPVTSTSAERGVERAAPVRPRARHDVGARVAGREAEAAGVELDAAAHVRMMCPATRL